jgi:uncharacterized membrane protein YkoI
MQTKLVGALAAASLAALGGTGVASIAGAESNGAGANAASAGAPASRLDDGAQYLSQAKISEQEAIRSAQSAASGALNEVDLEQYQGTLAWNVDVGAHDVKVDASTGQVLASTTDD